MPHHRPKIFSIAPGAPFIPTLIEAILDGTLYGESATEDDFFNLSDLTVYLPTRRAVQSMRRIMSDKLSNALLPNILALGDFPDDIEPENIAIDSTAPAINSSLSPAQRLLLLADLVTAWQKEVEKSLPLIESDDHHLIAGTATEVIALAKNLGTLLDTFTIHSITADALNAAAPSEQDEYWKVTHKFISIITRQWPLYLEAANVDDPLMASQKQIWMLARALETRQTQKKIIIAGSTGSTPATAQLMRAVARSLHGRIILPGLDQYTDENTLSTITSDLGEPNHPQFILLSLLEFLGIKRKDVATLQSSDIALASREWVAAQSQLPPKSTPKWQLQAEQKSSFIPAAFGKCAIIEASDEETEAKAIACAIRESVEKPDTTVALITTDRHLAERVTANLARWNLSVDDSAGFPLSRTSIGTFAVAIAQWISAPHVPENIMSMLAHTSATFGMRKCDLQNVMQILDLCIFRGRSQPSDLKMIIKRINTEMTGDARKYHSRAIKHLSDTDWFNTVTLIDNLTEMTESEPDIFQSNMTTLASHIANHRAVMQAALSPDHHIHEDDIDFIALSSSLRSHETQELQRFRLTANDFARIIPDLMGASREAKRERYQSNIKIWGILEARLMSADRIILSGLNEQSWPQAARNDAFLTRALRKELKLPLPERAIGQSAHDFVQSFVATSDVILTRSLKKDGAPTIASRFLQRLMAYVTADHVAWKDSVARGSRYIRYAKLLDSCQKLTPAERPAPIPSPNMLPTRIAITDAEILVRDPYAFYARKILHLEPAQPWNDVSTSSMKGQILHNTVAEIASIPGNAGIDIALWDKIISKYIYSSNAPLQSEIFWRQSFTRIGVWFLKWHAHRMNSSPVLKTEHTGVMEFDITPEYRVTLTGRADRIEKVMDGTALIDFKTGTIPASKDVKNGLSPQLTLEAAMVRNGAFGQEFRNSPIHELLYVGLKDSSSGSLEKNAIEAKSDDNADRIESIASDHFSALKGRMALHYKRGIGFVSRKFPSKSRGGGDYDHLARVAEWEKMMDDADDE